MLFHLDGEVEIAQKESGGLENRRIAADLSQKKKIIQLRKEKDKKFPNFRIKKLEKEIRKGDFRGLIIGRSEIKMGLGPISMFRRKNFKSLKVWKNSKKKIINFTTVRRMFSRRGEGRLDRPHSEMLGEEHAERAERPKKKRR